MKNLLRRNKFKLLAVSGLFSLLACSPQESKYVREGKPPQPASSDGSSDISPESGKALAQRIETRYQDEKIYGNLCLISEHGVTVVRSVYNTKTDSNKTHELHMETSLVTEDLLKAIQENIEADTLTDPKSRSNEESVSIYLFDSSKTPENSDLHLLFSHNSSGTEKRDHPLATPLIATINELCKAAENAPQRAK